MTSMESSKTSVSEQVVVLDKALKLAEEWVKQMKTTTDIGEKDIDEAEIQNRPARLGLGAKFLPHSQFVSTLNPIEKKLRGKLDAAKRQSALGGESSSVDRQTKSQISKCENDADADGDNSDSRTNAFHKKQTIPLANSLQSQALGGKKRKRKQKHTRPPQRILSFSS